MSLRNLEDQTVTVAGTEYFKVKRNSLSRKQYRAMFTNKKLKAEYEKALLQAAHRTALSGIVEHVPEPQYVSAPVPMTLVRAEAKEPLAIRKVRSANKYFTNGTCSEEFLYRAFSRAPMNWRQSQTA